MTESAAPMIGEAESDTMSAKTKQLASSIRHAIQASISRGLHDPRVRGLISITKVEVAPDHSEAYISVSILPAKDAALCLRGLESAAPKLRHDMGRAIHTRRLPRLVFRLDDSLKKLSAIQEALRDGKPLADVDQTGDLESADVSEEKHSDS